MTALKSVLYLLLTFSVFSCNNVAKDAKSASEMLTAKKWTILEINANEAPVLKDGKLIQRFGGLNFERYMEHVSFDKSGQFKGYFKGENTPMTLQWKEHADNITVFAQDSVAAKGGEWTITPKDVTPTSFSMITRSTAYDYPNMTKIELKFTSAE